MTAFALCGRGAGIFKMMHGNRRATAESQVTRALQVFSHAAGIEGLPLPQLFTTAAGEAKLEVVRGMIVDDRSIDISAASGKSDAANFLLAGLGVTRADGNAVEADEKLAEEGAAGAVTKLDFSELKAMLAALQSSTKIRVDLNEGNNQGALRKLEVDVTKQLGRKRATEEERTDLQSPFILALGDLIDIMASSPDTRQSRLKMGYR